MTLSFTIRFKPITEDSLIESFSDMCTYTEDDSPIEDAKKYLPFFQELVAVLLKDEEYLCDFKRSLLSDSVNWTFFDNYNKNDFATACKDDRDTRFYLEKHFDELSLSAQEQCKKLKEEDGDDCFLSVVEYHAALEYEVVSDRKK